MVEVSGLVDEAAVVEIEADAIVGCPLRRLPTPRSARALRSLRSPLAQGRARLLRQLRDSSLAFRGARRLLDVPASRGPLLRRYHVSSFHAGRQP
jgi:hypothetical protein